MLQQFLSQQDNQLSHFVTNILHIKWIKNSEKYENILEVQRITISLELNPSEGSAELALN